MHAFPPRTITSFFFGLLFLSPALAHAQDDIIVLDDISGANFFIAVIAGVILTLAFQLILAILSIAMGISLVGAIVEDGEAAESSMSNPKETTKNIALGFGLWALITTSLALFFGSWMGVELGYTSSEFIGVTLGLVIWAIVTMLIMMFEISMAGSLGKLAMGGMRSAFESVASVFSSSDKKKSAIEAKEISKAVLQELDGSSTVQRLLESVEGISMAMRGEESPGIKERAQQFRSKTTKAAEIVRKEAQSDKDAASKVADAAAHIAGVPLEQVQSYRKKLEDYLRTTGKDELQPERINSDLEKLFENPREGLDALLRDLSSINRSVIENMITASRADLSKEDSKRMADNIEKSLRRYQDKARRSMHDAKGAAGKKMGELQSVVTERMDDVRQGAYRAAEETRKIAASAAWWVLGSMVVSGFAAALGGATATS